MNAHFDEKDDEKYDNNDDYQKGDEVEAVVLAVDPERERISLGIKQALDDPFAAFVRQPDRRAHRPQGDRHVRSGRGCDQPAHHCGWIAADPGPVCAERAGVPGRLLAGLHLHLACGSLPVGSD